MIEWDETSGCARPKDLLDRIAATVGLRSAALGNKLLRLQTTTTAKWRNRRRVQLRLTTTAGAGERVFEAEGCDTLVEATVLVVGLALDPQAVARTAAARAIARGARGERARARFGGLLRLTAGADLGVLQGPSAGFAFALGARWPAFRLELEVARGLGRSSSVAARQAGAEIRIELRGGLRGCYLPWRSRVELGGCLGADLAWLRGTGVGIRNPAQGDAPWLAILAGARFGVRLVGPLWLRLEGLLGISAMRPWFEIDEIGEVHRSSLLTGRLGGGLEVWFR